MGGVGSLDNAARLEAESAWARPDDNTALANTSPSTTRSRVMPRMIRGVEASRPSTSLANRCVGRKVSIGSSVLSAFG